ncbi:hypothetical protein [Mycolicibacterium brisbanense]|uniref:Uncharacterized protein n=1 Tax=Mycolicibacterium brisbanense TaxID=146020 RepID=A0A100W4Z4_9MYCO|nr:hypothetical protein [Mycolicibacterium brisbanense]MCV7160330.1 hypothetical protein [Mycolicibacterium brisbanense]GAS91720.1 uncharacterized protein RMCB_5816 [Mycolicibacterium brisbanense]
MAATRKHCWECGASFYGRADARYCTGSCRQKAYRERAHRQAAMDTLPPPALADAIAVARQTRSKARAARERAADARQTSMEVRAKMHGR